MNPAATIYLATNQVNGKRYIGVTKRPVDRRFSAHCSVALRKPVTYFHRAIAKYGPNAFKVEAIASCLYPATVSEFERRVISQMKPEYNQTNGGEWTTGKKHTPDVIARIAEKNRGQKRTAEQIEANRAQAKARYESSHEYRAKVAANLAKALECLDRRKQKLAVGNAARNRIWSKESRDKLSRAKMRQVLCVDTGVEYASVREAAAAVGGWAPAVSLVCQGKQHTCMGLKFRYIDHLNQGKV